MTKWLLAIAIVAGCGGDSKKFPVEELEDPATCMECHDQHYTEWSGSMHAYASDDPVFVAMNKRGQRETNNTLGTFCVQCHAPMAVALGLTDGTDFDPTTLPPEAKGVTCFFCHDVKSVQDDHNNGLVLALDDTMRGGVKDPVSSPAHNSKYDTMMDGYTNNSVECGSCHDVVTPAGVALERTYTEWQNEVFASDDPAHHLPITCSGCHMQSEQDVTVIADKPGLNVKQRPNSFHLHQFPAVDLALTSFADMSDQMTAVQAIMDPALTIIGPRPTAGGPQPGGICVNKDQTMTVRMDTISIGHMFPSGAAQDRRVWLEVIAYDASNNVLFSAGVVPDGMDPEDLPESPVLNTAIGADRFYDQTFQADGTPAHFFWDVATEKSTLLKPAVTLDPTSQFYDHSTTATYMIGPSIANFDHVTARVRTLPIAYSVLQQLVDSGDLDPSIMTKQTVLDSAGATQSWTLAGANSAVPYTGCCPVGDYSC